MNMQDEMAVSSRQESSKDLIPLAKLPRHKLRLNPIFVLTVMLGLSLLLWPTRALRSDNFVFYFPNTRQVLPLEVLGQAKYLPLLPVLNLVGKVMGIQEKKNSLKVWFGSAQLELRLDERKVRLDKVWLSLSDPARTSNGQWMVPVDFLTTVLPKLTRESVEYQVGTNRIFLGDVKPSAFTVRLDQIGTGARLTVQFTDKVTVRTASSNGKWILFLGDHPVEPLEQTFRFQDPYVSELQFDDQDGVPKLILTPATSGLNFYPSLAEGGKVLLADVLKPPPVVARQPLPSEPATGGPPTPLAGETAPGVVEEVPEAPPGPPLPAVVLDAGHGGQEVGARSRDGVLEKDLVAQLVSRVRLALLTTKRYRIILTRVGDVDRSFEQRETAANLTRPILFLTFHAGNFGSSGPRVVVYSYRPAALAAPGGAGSNEPPALFVPWERVQRAHLARSRELALVLQQQFSQIPGVIAEKPREAPVRALRSVNAPAVAIEIGSLSPDADSGPVTNPNFLQEVSAAIAQSIAAFQGGGA
jgi:N-acetylmuramoyl-L-alanine amidase